jgi:hypothetical protein
MRLGTKQPIFVDTNDTALLDTMSKAALMDLAWNLASRGVDCDDRDAVRKVVYEEAWVTLAHRGDRVDKRFGRDELDWNL